MFINEITIYAFGKIENETFKFKNGLNLIYGHNETGKTTIMDFIKFMFYGMKVHKNTGELSFKEKYMPWSGNPAAGTLTLTCDNGEKYIISRQCSSDKNAVTVINALTGETDKSIDLKYIGKYFLGMNEDSFSYTAFLSDLSSRVKADREGELIKRLSNLSQSGNESVSFTNAFGKIQEEIALLSSERRKNAIIPSIKSKLGLLNDEIKKLESEKNISICKERIAEYQEKIKSTSDSNDSNFLIKAQILNEINALKNSEFLKFKNVSESEKQAIKKFSDGIKQQKLLNTIFFIGAVLVFIGLLGFVDPNLLVMLIPGVFTFCFWGILKKNNSQLMKKVRLIFEKYSCAGHNAFFEGIKTCESISAKINMLEDELSNLTHTKTEAIGEMEYKNNSNDFTIYKFNDKIDSSKEEFEHLSRNLFMTEQQLEICKQAEIKLLTLNEEKRALEGKLSDAQRKLTILNLSCDILKKAYDDLKQEFAPQLSKYASETLSEITSGKYDNILTGDEFKIKIKSDSGFFDGRFYSRGTYEQIYFSMRLALLNIAVRDKTIPLFLDDAFGFYDNDRFINVLKLIYKESKKRQVFLSSCRTEEYIYFRNQDVNVIELHSERND